MPGKMPALFSSVYMVTLRGDAVSEGGFLDGAVPVFGTREEAESWAQISAQSMGESLDAYLVIEMAETGNASPPRGGMRLAN